MNEKVHISPKNDVNRIVGMLNELVNIQNCRLEGYKKLQELFESASEYNNLFSEARSLSYVCKDYLKKVITIYGRQSSYEIIPYALFSLSAEDANANCLGAHYELIFKRFERGEQDVQNVYGKALRIASVPPFMSEILILQRRKLREQYYRIRKLNRSDSAGQLVYQPGRGASFYQVCSPVEIDKN